MYAVGTRPHHTARGLHKRERVPQARAVGMVRVVQHEGASTPWAYVSIIQREASLRANAYRKYALVACVSIVLVNENRKYKLLARVSIIQRQSCMIVNDTASTRCWHA
jgi:hypothetical protein